MGQPQVQLNLRVDIGLEHSGYLRFQIKVSEWTLNKQTHNWLMVATDLAIG